MSTIYLIDHFDVMVTRGEDVTFRLMSTTQGDVPVVIPIELFGTDNHFTLNNSGTSYTDRSVLATAPDGDFGTDWQEDEGGSAQQKHGTIRMGS